MPFEEPEGFERVKKEDDHTCEYSPYAHWKKSNPHLPLMYLVIVFENFAAKLKGNRIVLNEMILDEGILSFL